jgi:hypothetical protein
LGFVTITHPHHPLCGQQLPVVNVRQGQNPDVIVALPDGSHGAVALRDTDAAAATAADLPAFRASHLLSLGGLRLLARFIADLRQQGRFPGSS